jgi:hypothetical protein
MRREEYKDRGYGIYEGTGDLARRGLANAGQEREMENACETKDVTMYVITFECARRRSHRYLQKQALSP